MSKRNRSKSPARQTEPTFENDVQSNSLGRIIPAVKSGLPSGNNWNTIIAGIGLALVAGLIFNGTAPLSPLILTWFSSAGLEVTSFYSNLKPHYENLYYVKKNQSKGVHWRNATGHPIKTSPLSSPLSGNVLDLGHLNLNSDMELYAFHLNLIFSSYEELQKPEQAQKQKQEAAKPKTTTEPAKSANQAKPASNSASQTVPAFIDWVDESIDSVKSILFSRHLTYTTLNPLDKVLAKRVSQVASQHGITFKTQSLKANLTATKRLEANQYDYILLDFTNYNLAHHFATNASQRAFLSSIFSSLKQDGKLIFIDYRGHAGNSWIYSPLYWALSMGRTSNMNSDFIRWLGLAAWKVNYVEVPSGFPGFLFGSEIVYGVATKESAYWFSKFF